jgi:predicted methyltransferase
MLASRYSIVCLLAVMAACIQLDPLASERLAEGVAAPTTIGSSDQLEPGSPSRVDAAMRHSARLQAEHEQEKLLKAAEILNYFGIRQGMMVLDLYSGGDRYAELLSSIVGPTGRVMTHENLPYLSFMNNELAARNTDTQLDNVEQDGTDNKQLRLAPNLFDAVIMIKSYHDVYFVSEDEGWVKIDRSELLREIFITLKPGGILGIVDQVVDSGGTQSEAGRRSYQIDPAIVKHDMAVAGFIYAEEIDVLRNSDDDPAHPVIMPSAHDYTDSIVLRFRKP